MTERRSRVLLVGESNPYGSIPEFALWPEPEGCAGWRLCHTILGMERGEYFRTFDRVNLLDYVRWSAPAARRMAAALTHDRRILLGRKVAEAHGIREWVPFRIHTITTPLVPFCHLLTLPHPSGRNRMWNDPLNVAKALTAVADFLEKTGAH
jgi:hypothetical protein